MEFVVILLAALVVLGVVALIVKDRRERSSGSYAKTVALAPRKSISAQSGPKDPVQLARAAAEANAAPYASPFQPGEGYALLGVGRSANYAGRPGEHSQISYLVAALIRDSAANRSGGLCRSADRFPAEWSDGMNEAVGLKRAGEFLASAEAYIGLTRSSGVIYSGVVGALYKVVAASGALRAASELLVLGQEIFEADVKAMESLKMFGGQSAFEEHRADLVEASTSEQQLASYLRGISGNVNYRMPRDYASAMRELRS